MKKMEYVTPVTEIMELEPSEAVETAKFMTDSNGNTYWWDGHEWIPN